TYTILNVDLDGNPLQEPKIVALVNIDGTYGGLLHFLGEVELDELYIGLPVEAVFKPKKEREGSILDIKYFRPL
ncbi:MAG: OB-fold domain-containing protein, partial [Anaerolineae bacterium]